MRMAGGLANAIGLGRSSCNRNSAANDKTGQGERSSVRSRLGYDATRWDNGLLPCTAENRSTRRAWTALSPQQRAAAMVLGYRAREWDEDMIMVGGFFEEDDEVHGDTIVE